MSPLEGTQAPGTVLELLFKVINTSSRKNLVRFKQHGTSQAWAEVEPLLQDSRLLSTIEGGTGGSDGAWVYGIFSAPAWAALASVLKAYISRRSGRRVVLYGQDGTKLLEVTGDLTAEQIEALLRARVAPPELGAAPDAGEDRSNPPGGPAS